jgi:hypothetical protein
MMVDRFEEEEEQVKVFYIEGLLEVFEVALTFNSKMYYRVKIGGIIMSWWNIEDAKKSGLKTGDFVSCYYSVKKGYNNVNALYKKQEPVPLEVPPDVKKFVDDNFIKI